jgi:hypothetical protein
MEFESKTSNAAALDLPDKFSDTELESAQF